MPVLRPLKLLSRAAGLAAIVCMAGSPIALAQTAAAQKAPVESYVGRPVYSEPGVGLQMPPGCQIEPSWRGRIGSTDLEVWVVSCDGETRTWAVRRSIVEMVAANQARLRFQVTDDRRWPGEVAGDTVSVQCVGRDSAAAGFVVTGAKWKQAGAELRLTAAGSVLRVDPGTQKFVTTSLSQVDCARHPEREAMMRRLQQR